MVSGFFTSPRDHSNIFSGEANPMRMASNAMFVPTSLLFGSGGDTMFDVYSLAVTMWGIAIPLAVLGTYRFHWPVIVVYACTCIDEVGKIPWTLYHFRKYKWVKDLTHTGMEQKEKS